MPVEVILRNYRKSGELFHNRLVVKPLFGAAGEVLYFLGVQYDITKQVRAEEEIGKLTAKSWSSWAPECGGPGERARGRATLPPPPLSF